MHRVWMPGLCALLVASSALGQTPRPFPQPRVKAVSPPPAAPTPAAGTMPAPPPALAVPGEPTAAALGLPMYPTAQFVTSYDAGRGQRYYLFGTTASFADVVAYYRLQIKEKGTLVFEEPPTHMFEVGRFREESMAFPPGVTVKDWTFGGSQGYPNPKRGAQPTRFPTIVMVVPAPPAAAGR